MTDRELLELLVSKFESMETKIGSIDSKIGSMDSKVDSLESKVGSLEANIKDIKNELAAVKEQTTLLNTKLDVIEAKNAERHVTINSNIISIKEDLSRVEINTAENWKEIAKLKANKVAERENYKV